MLLAEALDGMGKTEDAIKELESRRSHLSQTNLFSTSSWAISISKKEIMTRRCPSCSRKSRTIRATPRPIFIWGHRAAHQ